MSYFDGFERYSVCIGWRHPETGYIKYFRIADYDPSADRYQLVPAIIPAHCTTREEAQENPDSLYNPYAADRFDQRDSDFFIFKWHQDTQNPNKQKTATQYDEVSIRVLPEPREVILTEGVSSEDDLRDRLEEGIPFEGNTTPIFYITYGHAQGGLVCAIECNRQKYSFASGRIKLVDNPSNPRMSEISAPMVLLEESEILETLHDDVAGRRIYSRLNGEKEEGRVLLRAPRYFAADYIKWFARDCGILLSKNDKRSLGRIIESAFDGYEMLEAYLDAPVSEKEISRLRRAIANYVESDELSVRSLVIQAVMEDEDLRGQCVQGIIDSGDPVLDALRKEKDELEKIKKSLDEQISSLQEDALLYENEVSTLMKAVDTAKQQADEARDEALQIEQELESNLALRLGLKLAFSGSGDSANGISSAPRLLCESYAVDSLEDASADVLSALSKNLKALGVMSLSGDSDIQRSYLSKAAWSVLVNGFKLAVEDSIAESLAQAVSAAFGMKDMVSVFVPNDYGDFGQLRDIVTESKGVVLISNVLDSVNEQMLFRLLQLKTPNPVLMGFRCFDNFKLLSREVWSDMVLAPSSQMVMCRNPRRNPKLIKSTGGLGAYFELEDVTECLSEAKKMLGFDSVPDTALFAAAVVSNSMKELDWDDAVPYALSSHFGILGAKYGCSEAVAKWVAANDLGYHAFVRKCGING